MNFRNCFSNWEEDTNEWGPKRAVPPVKKELPHPQKVCSVVQKELGIGSMLPIVKQTFKCLHEQVVERQTPIIVSCAPTPEPRLCPLVDDFEKFIQDQMMMRRARDVFPIDEESDEDDDEQGCPYVSDSEFPEGWGDEPVPPYSSEVLGPQVVEWMNGDRMVLGGGRGRKSKRGKGRGRGRGRAMTRRSAPKVFINRTGFWAPPRFRTHLFFDLRFTAAAASVLNPWSLQIIVLTNPNIFTGSATAVSGYLSLAAMYRKLRVRWGRLKYSCQNNEGYGIEIFATPVNFLPSTTLDPTRYLNMQNSRRRLLSVKGGIDTGSVDVSASVSQFGGSANTTVEDNYVGTTDNTSPPSDNLYIIYGYMTNGAATVAYNLNVITVEVEIDFFELQSPAG